VAANLFYVYKAQIAQDPIAPIIGFGAAIATFSKTVLYWAQEYYCGYCAVGHNDIRTLFWLWIIPNGWGSYLCDVTVQLTRFGYRAWLVFPGMIIWSLYGDIAKSLRATSVPRQSTTVGRKSGKSQ
jgi:hypothetical protein